MVRRYARGADVQCASNSPAVGSQGIDQTGNVLDESGKISYGVVDDDCIDVRRFIVVDPQPAGIAICIRKRGRW